MSKSFGYAQYQKTQQMSVSRLSQQIYLLFEKCYQHMINVMEGIKINDYKIRLEETDKVFKVISGLHSYMYLYIDPQHIDIADLYYKKLLLKMLNLNSPQGQAERSKICEDILLDIKYMVDLWKEADQILANAKYQI